MVKLAHIGSALIISAALVGCNSGGGSPFSNPFGASPARVVTAPPQPQLPVVAPPPSGAKPSITINASPARVQDAIIARARSRGTTVVGANQTGVTLEVPLKTSSEVVQEQCGAHRADRTLRVYLETLPNGSGTNVTEDRFVIDGGQTSCQLKLTSVDIEGANKSLADLKQQAEARRTASSAARPSDPPGGLSAVNPGRPVVPLR